MLIASVLVCTACGSNRPYKSVSDDRIVVGMALEPLGFYPLRALDSGSYYAQTLVYEGLLRYDADLNIVPGMASSFTVSEDGLTYTLKLRPDLKFSDGKPVSLDDVEATLRLAQSKGSPFKGDYACISSWQRDGQATIVLHLSEPSAPLLSRLVELRILPKSVLEKSDHGYGKLSREPIGTGPFRLLRWESGLELVFIRNEFYWGEKPSYEKLVWRILPDKTLTALALNRAEIDVAQLDPATWQAISERHQRKQIEALQLDDFPGTRTIYLGFNTRRKPFDNVSLRQAICQGIDRANLVHGFFKGYGTVPNTDIAPGSWAYNPDVRQWPYDPQKAKELLERAGFRFIGQRWVDPRAASGEGNQVAFRILTIRDYQDVAQVVSDDLRIIGVPTEVQLVEYATLRQRYLIKGEFDTVLWSRSSGPDPECSLVWSKGGALNYAKFTRVGLDDLIENGRRASTRAQRIEAYKEIQRILANELPWVFLVQPNLLVAHQANIVNVKEARQDLTGLPWDNPLFNAARWQRVPAK